MFRNWNSAPTRWPACAWSVALVTLLSLGLEVVMNAAVDDVQARNKQAIAAGFEAWRNGTGSVFDLLAPEASWTIVGNPFNARLSSRLVPTMRGIYADGDMVIALFDGRGTARDGRPYSNTYTWYMEMREGKIVNVIAFFDTIEFTDFWKRIQPAP
jgi:ketosteroid isomerase-like protein